MNRKSFLKAFSILPFSGGLMKLYELGATTSQWENSTALPVFFFGHGSPMNAIEDNEFSRAWKNEAKSIPTPKAILCISAHWETRGVYVTAMEKPATIHDFGGFPKALFDVEYPAAGSPTIAQLTKDTISSETVGLDQNWGLDHGCWSILKHLYPNADIPVLQLSLNVNQSAQWHFELGKELNALRKKGILIIGSGNIVHNLGIMNWNMTSTGYDWAIEANDMIKNIIKTGEQQRLAQYTNLGKAVQLSVPTPEHFLPLLYVMALKGKDEPIHTFNDKTVMGSIAMTSFRIG